MLLSSVQNMLWWGGVG